MRLLARQLRLIALALACGALYLAPRSYSARPPARRHPRLWEIWPRLHNSQQACWRCGQPRWGEDLTVQRLVWGGAVAVCDACVAEEASV